MINFNPNISNTGSIPKSVTSLPSKDPAKDGKTNFAKFVDKYISEVDSLQQESDTAITQLLSGKNQDINSVVAAVAKADISFKLLVNVRNKIIEAYKQTMNMSI